MIEKLYFKNLSGFLQFGFIVTSLYCLIQLIFFVIGIIWGLS